MTEPDVATYEDIAFRKLLDGAAARQSRTLKETLDQIEGWPTHLPPMPLDPKALEAAQALTQDTPAWVPCPDCDNFFCTIHGIHAHDCACPELEFWDSVLGLNPYEDGGDLTPDTIETLKSAHGYVEE